jgi:hypothetical protein
MGLCSSPKSTPSSEVISSATTDLGQIGKSSLASQAALAPQQYALEAQYRPQYSNLTSGLVRSNLLGGTTTTQAPNPVHLPEYNRVKAAGDTRSYEQWFADHKAANPGLPDDGFVAQTTTTGGLVGDLGTAATALQGTQNAVNTSARGAGLADLKALGSSYNDAWRAANPQLSGLQDKLYGDATSGSALLQTLKGQTLTDLQNAGKLSADETRDVQQSVRSAYGARGLAGSNSAIFAEALNRSRYANERKAQAQNQALTVDNYATGLTNQATNTLANTSFDPSTILDQSGTGLASSFGAYGMANEQVGASTPAIFNPYSSDIMSYYAGEKANATARDTAKANSSSAKTSAGISAVAGIAGAALPLLALI